MIETIIIYCAILYVLSFIFKPRVGILCCGLVGFSGKTNYSLDKIKMLMLWNSIERGKDATGIFTPRTGILKDNDPAGKFFYSKQIEKLEEDNTLIAHVRFKTVGANLAKNAHPFVYGNTVLAHNGTLSNTFKLGDKYGIKSQDWDVDSQVIASAINKAFERKEEKSNFDVLGEYNGFAALLFYNEDTGYLYAFHDKERPLFYGWDKESNMYISSIDDALKAAGLFDIKSFEINKVYTIKNGDILDKQEYKLYEETHKEEIAAEKEKERLAKSLRKSNKAMGRNAKFQFPKLVEGQRGLEKGEDTDMSQYVGFYLKAKTTNRTTYEISSYGRTAICDKDTWYLCTGYFEDSKSLIEIEDEQGFERVVYAASFDLTNFIPLKGDKVSFTIGVSAKKGHEDLWNEGDVAEIIDMDYNEMKAMIYNDKLKKAFGVPSIYFRPADGIEVINNNQEEIEEAQIIEEEEENIQDLLMNMRRQEHSDDFVDYSILEGLVDNINTVMNKLEEKYQSGGDITGEINEVNAILNCSSDLQYLSTCKKSLQTS